MGFVKSCRDRYGDYLAQVKQLGPDHELGGPQGPMAEGLLEAMIATPLCLGEEGKAYVEKVLKALREFKCDEVMEVVQVFRIQRAFSKKRRPKMVKIKISWTIDDKFSGLLNSWLSDHKGCRRMLGMPAPTTHERDVRRFSKR